jgi:hypothetical protein
MYYWQKDGYIGDHERPSVYDMSISAVTISKRQEKGAN